MTLELAARMAAEVFFIFCGMVGVACVIGFMLERRSEDYPPVDEALADYSEADDSDQQDFEEGTEPPRTAA